jgi:hypothetical protein
VTCQLTQLGVIDCVGYEICMLMDWLSSTYRVTITDKYDASNSLVFTFTLELLPIWD